MLNNTFDGPAFLTWSRGQGTFGVGGPLPNYWIESQHALQVKIMNRLRDLGMYGILPGFQGNVPQEMPEIFPHANTSNGWLDALDPLFDTIGHGVGTAMQAEFGPGSFVEADGWFALETGPWLSSDSTSVAALGDGADAAEEAGCFFGRVDQDGHPIPFIIPSEEEAFTRASSVFASLVAAKPDATWVYQGYPWFRVYSQGAKCNQTALRLFVKGFTDAIPKDRLLVLDLVADSPGRALWRYPADPVIGPFARNASLIWCALNNWGGAVHIGGDISYVLNETRAAMATPNVNGVGLTPEGIDNSPAYFSLVLDSAWTEQPTARDWLQEWGAGRCGAANIKAAAEAYDLLFQTVYRPGKPYLWCCSNPVFCPTVHPGEAPAKPDYNVTLLRKALELMVEAAPSCPGSGFHYDLVDVAREWLSMSPCLAAFDKIDKTAPAPELTAQVEALLEVGRDADDMMATDEGFLLGKWLKSSREVSDWDGSGGSLADFYEWNSRVQITTWAGGYSRREWSGMVKEYYAGRVKVWLNNTLAASAASAAAADTNSATTSTYRAVQGFDCNFQDIARHKSECAGKSTAACIAILERLCDADAACIGFNSPGDILKKGCSGWEAAPHSTMFFKPGHVPPNLPPPPTSSCVDGFCSTRVVNGTHNGTTCGGACPAPPKPPPLASQLADFASRWQNETWTEAALPSKPVGDAVAMAKKLLAKYKSDDGTGAKIDRAAVVARHDVMFEHPDGVDASETLFDVLTVGNGQFGFTADLTGLQSLNNSYHRPRFPLYTMSNWGWHTPDPALVGATKQKAFLASGETNYVYENVSINSSDTRPGKGNRTVPYQFNCDKYNDPALCQWWMNFPARVDLGQLSFVLAEPPHGPNRTEQPTGDFRFIDLAEISSSRQKLDMYTGALHSNWSHTDARTSAVSQVRVLTAVDSETDSVLTRFTAPASMPLAVQLAFCTVSRGGYACDWSKASQLSPHTTTVLKNASGRLDLGRKNGEHDSYSVSCTYNGAPGLVAVQTSEHAFAIHRPSTGSSGDSVTVDVVCRYQLGCCVGTAPPVPEGDLMTKAVPSFETALSNSEASYKSFWEDGAFVDISGATSDPRAFELERRTVQSLYLMRSQEAGAMPPQESGLLYNSWTGKHHSEVSCSSSRCVFVSEASKRSFSGRCATGIRRGCHYGVGRSSWRAATSGFWSDKKTRRPTRRARGTVARAGARCSASRTYTAWGKANGP